MATGASLALLEDDVAGGTMGVVDRTVRLILPGFPVAAL